MISPAARAAKACGSTAGSVTGTPDAGIYRGLRLADLKKPSTDILMADLLLQHGTHTGWAGAEHMRVIPHGLGGKPTGVNQSYADGSVRWHPFNTLNTQYYSANKGHRQTALIYHRDISETGSYKTWSKTSFNYGGYPNKAWWNERLYDQDWYGVATHGLFQHHAYDPNP